MSQWGNNDNSANSVLWGPTSFNKRANTANRNALYDSTNQTVPGQKSGVFGVSATEMQYGCSGALDAIATVPVTAPGSNFTNASPATVTLTGGAGANAVVVPLLKLDTVTIVSGGTSGSYIPGDKFNMVGNTSTGSVTSVANVTATEIRTATPQAGGTGYVTGDTVTLQTGTGTSALFTVTASGGVVSSLALTNKGSYTVNPSLNAVATSNTTGVGTGLTVNVTTAVKTIAVSVPGSHFVNAVSSNFTTTATGTGASFTATYSLANTKVLVGGLGYTSAPTATYGNATLGTVTLGARVTESRKVAHSGWQIRREGTGGRAGRVTYETLVACKIKGDGNDDNQIP